MAVVSDRNVIPLGSEAGRKQSIVVIPAEQGTPEKPGVIALESSADTTGERTRYFLWMDTNGALRAHTAIPTNQDGDGSAVGSSSGATVTLNNLTTTAINAALIPADGTIDLGTDAKPFRTEHLLTSLVLNQTTGNYTLTWDNPGAARAISIPDPGATATVMLNAGAANTISYVNGTSSITFGANSDLDIAAAKTVNIDVNVTANTEDITLNQSLSTTDAVAFATGSTIGNLTLANGSITDSGGAISFGNENLTTTGTINIAADSVKMTWGADGATDAYIQFDGSNLKLYDSNLGVARSLTELYSGTTLNPNVSGDLTIPDGKLTWTNATAEASGVWTFAGTSTTDIAIASSITTGKVLSITADACANGTLAYLDADGGVGASGYYVYCYNGSAAKFTVGEDGATVIGGNAIATAALTLTKGDLVMSDGRLLVTLTGDNTSKISRNVTTLTSAILEIENTHISGGVCLLLDQDATGDLNALEITNAGTGYAATTTAAAAGGGGFEYIAATSGTGKGLFLDGSTGSWIGADNTGLAEITSDGVLAAGANLLRVTSSGLNAAGSFLCEIEQTGKVVGATDGICLKVSETAAATATSYAVCIASTNNEALHVDTGQTLFDEKVTISTTDNEGIALAIVHPDTTGNTNAVTIQPSGSGAGLYVNPQEADTMAISVVGKTASTVSLVKVDGTDTDGWYGANNVGMVHLVNDGTYAHVGASMLYIQNSGVPQDDAQGYCLRIIDTGNAAAGTMAYPVYITSNDATVGGVYISTNAAGAALTVAAGTASFAGVTTFTAGLKTKVAVTDTANPPTNAEMITAFGAAATAGAGFLGVLDDANGHANEYICWSDGTKWWYVTGTAGA
jgi:hypothetical protein